MTILTEKLIIAASLPFIALLIFLGFIVLKTGGKKRATLLMEAWGVKVQWEVRTKCDADDQLTEGIKE